MKDKKLSIGKIIGISTILIIAIVIVWFEAYVIIPIVLITIGGIMKEFSKKAQLEAAIKSLVPLIKDKPYLYVFEMMIGNYKFTYRPPSHIYDSTHIRLVASNGEYIYDNFEDGVNNYLDEDKLEPIIDLVKSKVEELEIEYRNRRKSINDVV